jgi:thioredoxin 2
MPLLIACPNCAATNRVVEGKRGATCGRCKSPLPDAGYAETASDANWVSMVGSPGLPVLVDFWAPWCGPCKMVGPAVEAVAQKYFGRLRVAKLNTDENPQTAGAFQIRSIPTLAIFRDGKVVDRLSGAVPQAQLESWVERHLA